MHSVTDVVCFFVNAPAIFFNWMQFFFITVIHLAISNMSIMTTHFHDMEAVSYPLWGTSLASSPQKK